VQGLETLLLFAGQEAGQPKGADQGLRRLGRPLGQEQGEAAQAPVIRAGPGGWTGPVSANARSDPGFLTAAGGLASGRPGGAPPTGGGAGGAAAALPSEPADSARPGTLGFDGATGGSGPSSSGCSASMPPLPGTGSTTARRGAGPDLGGLRGSIGTNVRWMGGSVSRRTCSTGGNPFRPPPVGITKSVPAAPACMRKETASARTNRPSPSLLLAEAVTVVVATA